MANWGKINEERKFKMTGYRTEEIIKKTGRDILIEVDIEQKF